MNIPEPIRLIESMPLGLMLCKMDGSLVYTNPSFASMVGYSPEELLELNCQQLTPQKYTFQDRIQLGKLESTGRYGPYEKEYCHRSGHLIPVRMNGEVVEVDGEPHVWSCVEVIRDIKASEKTWKKIVDKFYALFESATDGLFLLSMDGFIVDVNEIGHSRLGYRKEEMLGRPISDFDAPEFASRVSMRLEQIKTYGGAQFESAHLCRDGRIIPVEIGCRLVEIDGGTFCFSVIRDISRRKALMDRVHERDAMFRAVFETSQDGFWVVDMQGHFLEVNDAYVEMSGYSREELLGMNVVDIEAKEVAEETAAHIEKLMREGHDRFESYHLRKNGEVWPVEIVSSYWDISGGRIFVFVIDISERKRAEDAMRDARQSAEAANMEKSRFLAAASHDLRQPLQALHLYISSMFRVTDEKTRDRLLQGMLAASDSLGDLLNALLDISRLDVDAVQPQFAGVALGPLMHELATEFQPQAAEKGIALRIRDCGDVVVRSDPVLLRRMLRNILSNAVRHTERGGLLFGCRRAGGWQRIGIWDTGPGIAGNELESVFKEFYQLHNPERDREKGLGLGLSIVRRLSGLLDHPVHLQSRPGRGTCFYVDVPLYYGIEDDRYEEAWRASAPTLADRFVLVVDDELSILDAMRQWLRRWDCEVLAAESGEALLEELSRHAYPLPDAMIVDYRLRDHRTGLDVVRSVRTHFGKEIPAVIISGDTSCDIVQAVEHAICQYLPKPAQERDVLDMLVQLTSGN